MDSQKVVIPAEAGIQTILNLLKTLDSRFHWNDVKWLSAYDPTIIEIGIKGKSLSEKIESIRSHLTSGRAGGLKILAPRRGSKTKTQTL